MFLRTLVVGVSMFAVSAAYSQPASQTSQTAPAAMVDSQQFADMAASSNMFEIESSRVALEKSANAEVTAFAQHMIDDHGQAGEEMEAAAMEDGITPAPGLQPAHQAKLDELTGMDGESFDTAYIDAQVAAHDEAIGLFESFSTTGEDSALKAFATKTLPTLESHREDIGALAGM